MDTCTQTHTYDWVPLLSTWYYHYIVNWLYSNIKLKVIKKKINMQLCARSWGLKDKLVGCLPSRSWQQTVKNPHFNACHDVPGVTELSPQNYILHTHLYFIPDAIWKEQGWKISNCRDFSENAWAIEIPDSWWILYIISMRWSTT